MTTQSDRLPYVLLALTLVTGVVDAVSFLALGHVFTANMTGNVVFMGFAAAGASGLSLVRSGVALVAFLAGAVAGGRLASRRGWPAQAFGLEAALLLLAAFAAAGIGPPENPAFVYLVIILTGVAMGVRNATVRKLAVPDLTTTVLTLTLTGIAADSTLAGGNNPRWQRRAASVLLMFAGAAIGALMMRASAFAALAVCAVISAAAAVAVGRLKQKETTR